MTKKEKNIYTFLRSALFLLALSGLIWLAFSIIFPQEEFLFNFKNPRATKNTLANPRNSLMESLENGNVMQGENLIFDASVFGNFSESNIRLYIDSENNDLQEVNPTISLKKGFQAFFYDDGGILGFPDGELLKNNEDYYFVSGDDLLKFSSGDAVLKMGFDESNFLEVDDSDLMFNSIGNEILGDYPIGTVFLVGNNYYKQEEDGLRAFLNPEAYLSHYRKDLSIKKDSTWLEGKNILDGKIGFASGTLLAYGTSAFIVSDGILLPIGDAQIFLSKGFSWDDLVNVGGDTVSFYEKGKLFALDSPHPAGTIFKTIEDNEYYLIKDNKKYSLPSEKITFSRLKNVPVEVSKESLEIEKTCQLSFKKTFWGKKYLDCNMNVQELNSLLGTDFEFNFSANEDVNFSDARIVLIKNINKDNFNLFFADIIGRVKQHYDK